MKNKPLVSIIITTYKRPSSLVRAINSVLNQTYSNIEIVVVDDNNPNTEFRNETKELMEQYNENTKVKYIKHSENKNGAAARNTGINHSDGYYVTFLDDDDEYREDKIEKQVHFLENNNAYEGVYCGWQEGADTIYPKYKGDLTFYLLSGEVRIVTNAIMISRDSALSIGGWDITFRRNQEAALLLRFFDAGYEIGYVPEILFDQDTEASPNASNASQNEEDFDYYLDVHERQIKESSKKLERSPNNIYSFRYRGVLLRYVKQGDYSGAFKLYSKMMKKIPLRFNKDIFVYIIKRLLGKDIYS